MSGDFITNLLKVLHLFFIIMGVGGALGQFLLVRRFRQAHPSDAEASEKMAVVLARFLEVYGLLFALITGVLLAFKMDAFRNGYLHVKILLVLIVVGLSHMELSNLKRMVALRAAGKSSEEGQLKQKHLMFTSVSLLLIVVITWLVVFKPF